MAAEDQLLADILRDPDSDAARIAYAAWAKSVGNPRGELIEVQLEEARKHRAHTYVADWVPYAKRGREILKLYDGLWLRPIRDLLGVALHRAVRHLEVELGQTFSDLLDCGPQLVHRSPTLHGLGRQVLDHRVNAHAFCGLHQQASLVFSAAIDDSSRALLAHTGKKLDVAKRLRA